METYSRLKNLLRRCKNKRVSVGIVTVSVEKAGRYKDRNIRYEKAWAQYALCGPFPGTFTDKEGIIRTAIAPAEQRQVSNGSFQVTVPGQDRQT